MIRVLILLQVISLILSGFVLWYAIRIYRRVQ